MILPQTQPGCDTEHSNRLEHSLSEAFRIQYMLSSHHLSKQLHCTAAYEGNRALLQHSSNMSTCVVIICSGTLAAATCRCIRLRRYHAALICKLRVGSGKQTRPGCTVHGLHPHQLSNDLGCQHDLIHSDSRFTRPLAGVSSHELLRFPARRARLLCCWCPDLDVMLNACTTTPNMCGHVQRQISQPYCCWRSLSAYCFHPLFAIFLVMCR